MASAFAVEVSSPVAALLSVHLQCQSRGKKEHPAMYLNPRVFFRTASAYVKDFRSVSRNTDAVCQIVDTSIL
jgi:hypothetical protein